MSVIITIITYVEIVKIFPVLLIRLCLSMWWINRKMKQSKEDYIYARRKTRQAKKKSGKIYVAIPLNETTV